MIVSPRRLILAITLAPPVIKIKQQLLCLNIHYMRIKNLGHFFYLHIVYMRINNYPHIHYTRIKNYPHIHYMRIKPTIIFYFAGDICHFQMENMHPVVWCILVTIANNLSLLFSLSSPLSLLLTLLFLPMLVMKMV